MFGIVHRMSISELFAKNKASKTTKNFLKNSIQLNVNLLKRESINFPKLLKDYMDEKFFPDYKKFIHFLEKRHKGKLDNTNNQIENYIGNTMPRAHKKKFRTMEGVFNQIMLQKNGWIEKRNQELTF